MLDLSFRSFIDLFDLSEFDVLLLFPVLTTDPAEARVDAYALAKSNETSSAFLKICVRVLVLFTLFSFLIKIYVYILSTIG
ncbi:hypothetical protein HYD_3310 [Candidatus Hydrogenosomobacter endosymbioticus]|uniref:Uncharacterized protein n=1 Tax=Candidatus Hydrogenosomobacter endosymbioticus TaxID=2558174 RepID=A0ABN6L304_9PROT|nr:hypothetical protein HYD_3310 [Candidatus Hydrogenosomobacter endosymbioticus]